MTRGRFDGMLLFLLGCVLFTCLGFIQERSSQVSMLDFKNLYYGTRCLTRHCDPYRESELQRVYQSEEGNRTSDPKSVRRVVTLYINLPTSLVLLAPLGMLAWGPAHLTWMVLTAVSFMLASFLMWRIAADNAPVASAGLICILLLNSTLLLEIGNAAGITISLCVVAACCIICKRFIPAGVLCLAISLALKPHDSGVVWLFFVLAGGAYKKRAFQALAVAALIILPSLLWVSQEAPNWMGEFKSNLVETSAHGDVNDPGPTALDSRSHGAAIIDLQTVMSLFRDDPKFYNLATYLTCAPFFLLWCVATLRQRPSPRGAWLALAAIAPLSMLPFYHRTHDTRLMLLELPALSILWARRGLTGWLALTFTSIGALVIGIFPEQLLGICGSYLKKLPSDSSSKLLEVVLNRPVPLILLVMGLFYLQVYLQHVLSQGSSTGQEEEQFRLPSLDRSRPPQNLNGDGTASNSNLAVKIEAV